MKKGDFDMKEGFTIIEVSLVLAIAGLILLMVFVALPAVQRMQRDAERKENISEMLQALKKYQTNNRGALPEDSTESGSVGPIGYSASANKSSWAGFYKEYLGSGFTDPNGQNYQLWISDCSNSVGQPCTGTVNGIDIANLENVEFPSGYNIYVLKHASCDGATAIGVENPRRVAVMYKLEGAGVYCANT